MDTSPPRAEKAQAESIATSVVKGQVGFNQIAVLPVGSESDARTMNSDLDKNREEPGCRAHSEQAAGGAQPLEKRHHRCQQILRARHRPAD
jgi:hypothetical protein